MPPKKILRIVSDAERRARLIRQARELPDDPIEDFPASVQEMYDAGRMQVPYIDEIEESRGDRPLDVSPEPARVDVEIPVAGGAVRVEASIPPEILAAQAPQAAAPSRASPEPPAPVVQSQLFWRASTTPPQRERQPDWDSLSGSQEAPQPPPQPTPPPPTPPPRRAEPKIDTQLYNQMLHIFLETARMIKKIHPELYMAVVLED